MVEQLFRKQWVIGSNPIIGIIYLTIYFMNAKLKNSIYKTIIFFPLLFYFGKRSYIAYDEGFYALQAKWMLQNNNWVVPVWWDQFVLDRTIGIQFLIAKCQQIFGETAFIAHLPSTVAAILMLFLTYKLHQELIGRKDAIFSALILGTTYIWLDFAHLATQDMIFACLVTLGTYSLAKIRKDKNSLYLLIFGSWIGLAFFMKTFLIAIPLLSLLPYLIYKRQIIIKQFFWLGIFIGFLPFLIWSFYINPYLDKNIIFYLIDKVNTLSVNNTFTNPIYYYFWNIPVNFLPWSIFSLIGLIYQFRDTKQTNYFLVYYPLLFIFILSLFSTKTPYYSLPIASILSLNAFLGFKATLKINQLKVIFLQLTSKIIPVLIFFSIFIYFLLIKESINLNFKEEVFLITGFFISAFMLITITNYKKFRSILLSFLVCPYLIGSCMVQSGLLTDRSRNLREIVEYISAKEGLHNKTVNVISNNSNVDDANSKLIKILLITPNLGKDFRNLNELKPNEYAWIVESNNIKIKSENYQIIASDKDLDPWKLIKKKI